MGRPPFAREALDKARAGEPLKPVEQRFVDYARQTAHDYAQEHADEVARHEQALQEQNDIERQQDIDALRNEAAQLHPTDANGAMAYHQWVARALDSGVPADDIQSVMGSGTLGERVTRLAQAIRERGNEDDAYTGTNGLDRTGNDTDAHEGQVNELPPARGGVARPGEGSRGDLFPAASSADRLRAAREAKDAERNGLNRHQQPFTNTDLGATPHGEAPEQATIPPRPQRSASDGQEAQSGVPEGLPVEQTDATRRLAKVINTDVRRRKGVGAAAARFREVRRDSLPVALHQALTALQKFAGLKGIHVVRNMNPNETGFAFNGVSWGDGHLYVDERAQSPVVTVAAHEFLHQLKKDAPDLYGALADEMARQARLAPEKASAWVQEARSRGYKATETREELTADATGDALSDPEFLRRMAERNPSAFRELAQRFIDFINQFLGRARDLGSNPYLHDVAAFRDKLAGVLDEFHGRNRRGELEPLPGEFDVPPGDPDYARRVGEPREHDQEFVDAAKRFFGTTLNPREAGYITPDGSMLDFTGRHYSQDHPTLRGHRNVDHRELTGENNRGESLDDFFKIEHGSGSDYMQEFMTRTGSMRVDARAGVASIMGEPTPAQMRVLSNALHGDYAALSMIDPNTGRIIGEAEIDRPTPQKIARFFANAAKSTPDNNAPLFSRRTRNEQMRTPEFKHWFGDWERGQHAKVLQGEPVASVRIEDAPSGGYKEVEQWAAKLFAEQGGKAKNPELGEVVLDERAAKDSMAHGGANAAKKAAFAAVKDVIEHGAVVHHAQDAQKDSYYISAPVDISGKSNIVTVLVRRDPNTQRMYLHAVTLKENLLTPRVSAADAGASEPRGSTESGDVASVLRDALNFNHDAISKAVDADGKPLTLYHGTGDEFYSFDPNKAGGSTAHMSAPLGHFLTEDRGSADRYADKASEWNPTYKRVIDAHVSIKRPFEMTTDDLLSIDSQAEARALRAKLEREGYDGIHIADAKQWVAFRPEQIKSASENRGTFDQDNPDIRFSRASEEPADRAGEMGRGASGPDVTGVKNEQTKAEREARGLHELHAEGKRSHGAVWAAAEGALRDDPQAGGLAAEIARARRGGDVCRAILTPKPSRARVVHLSQKLRHSAARLFVSFSYSPDGLNVSY